MRKTEITSAARTLKQAIENKRELKSLRRKLMATSIESAIGQDLKKSTWREFTQDALLGLFRDIMGTDPTTFVAGWNYSADTQSAEYNAAPFYVSVKDASPVLAGSARSEWIAARNIIDQIAADDEVDYDQAMRQWLELPEDEQFKIVPPAKKAKKRDSFQPVMDVLLKLAHERGLTVKALKELSRKWAADIDKAARATKKAA